ncbi:MAG: sulfurtransferase [Chloroflexi bacterium]|nr:sulfurtransferase [Chloroflexota bacterium]
MEVHAVWEGMDIMQSPLVSTAWLEEHLQDEKLRIVELRGKVLPPTEPPPHYLSDAAGYKASHIPNAQFVDWLVDIVEPGSPSNDIAAPEKFAALMSRLGIGKDHRVIVYDNLASMLAGRMRWALRYYGHSDARVLDGGWERWLAEGRPVSTAVPQFEPTVFETRVDARLIANADDILAGLSAGDMQLIDVRSPAEYAGETSRANTAGHIPGAISAPWQLMLADDKTVKPANEVRAELAKLGIDLQAKDTVLYCNSGVSATVGMLAMEIAGADNLRLYDGSWTDWGNNPSTPKATSA